MGLFFRKRVMKLPFGGRLTFGTGGFGLSFGKKNVRLHLNRRGTYLNTKIPKTNVYVGKKIGKPATIKEKSKTVVNKEKSGGCGMKIGCCFLILFFFVILSFAKDVVVNLWNGNGINGDAVWGIIFYVVISLLILCKEAK